MADVLTIPRRTAEEKLRVQRMTAATVHHLNASDRKAEKEAEDAKLYHRLRGEAEDALAKLLAQIKNVQVAKDEAKAITGLAMVRIFGCLND